MQIKCEYCGSMIDEAATKCPYCGATNQSVKRSADHTPKTIAELQQWYQDRHLPPYETTRFFIGINYTKPKAFGIYQDGDQFIVYKNKANGERAIRYKGTDEAYAVNELYLKLKDEILNQKALNQQKKQYSASSKAKKKHSVKDFFKSVGLFFCIIIPIGLIVFIDSMVKGFGAALFCSIFVAVGLLVLLCILGRDRHVPVLDKLAEFTFGEQSGLKNAVISYALLYVLSFILLFIPLHNYYGVTYYHYNDTIYANTRYSWFEYYDDSYYGDYDKIDRSSIPADLLSNKSDYRFDLNDDTEWAASLTEFEDSSYYDDHYASHSDSDSSYDWDSGSDWDSGGTDWDSDW